MNRAVSEMPLGNSVIDEFKSLYQVMNAENCKDLLGRVYADQIVFEDPFHRIEGFEQYLAYCESLYENVLTCRFVFHDEWVSDGKAMLTWTMHLAHKRINKGREYQVAGASKICFDEKIYLHQDYYDGGALLYEHLPLLGSAIRALKNRLA